MWFQLNTTFQTHLGALSTLQSNYGVTYSLSNFTKTTAPDMVEKDKSLTVVLKMVEGATFTSATMTDGTTSVTGTLASSDNTVTMTIAQVKGPVTVIARAASASVTPPEEEEPETPVTPTNYTFTINPTPTSATVTLSATGYSTVSGTGSKSITVASGTVVSYNVSASGYTSQSGTQTVTSTSTKNISLSESSSSSGTTVKLFNDNRTIVNSIADMSFTTKLALSNTNALTNVTGRASDHTHALAATAGQTVTLSQPISGVTLTYALVCFNSSGATCSKEKNFLAQAWISSSVTLPTNTAYVMIAFKRGDGTSDFSSSELAQLTSALTFA